MGEVAYVSNVRIERVKGPIRKAYLPGEAQPVIFSIHGGIAKHYGLDEKLFPEQHAATIDYVVAGLGGWMLGTFGGALEARKINAQDGRLSCEVRGEVEAGEDRVLIIKRVHVSHRLRAEKPDEVRETVDRVHGIYAQKCPVYRSLSPAFQITSSVEVVPEQKS